MFLYPILYRSGVFALSPEAMGIFTGSTIHEVAHVVGAGNAMGKAVSDTAIIVKMIRVMMLVPVLLVISYSVARAALKNKTEDATAGRHIQIPWFAILFLVVIGFNSFNLLPQGVVSFINTLDTFLLTMAMTALGAETSIEKFRKAGFKPFLLALYPYTVGSSAADMPLPNISSRCCYNMAKKKSKVDYSHHQNSLLCFLLYPSAFSFLSLQVQHEVFRLGADAELGTPDAHARTDIVEGVAFPERAEGVLVK
jgi:hypothetical protein